MQYRMHPRDQTSPLGLIWGLQYSHTHTHTFNPGLQNCAAENPPKQITSLINSSILIHVYILFLKVKVIFLPLKFPASLAWMKYLWWPLGACNSKSPPNRQQQDVWVEYGRVWPDHTQWHTHSCANNCARTHTNAHKYLRVFHDARHVWLNAIGDAKVNKF